MIRRGSGGRTRRWQSIPTNRPAAFEAENTGGVLCGLFGRGGRIRPPLAVAARVWGVAAVGAVMSRSSPTNRRSDGAASRSRPPIWRGRRSRSSRSPRRARTETRRLASAIDTLNSDRDRLYSRVTVLEQGLDSVTGAIARQTTPPVAPPARATPAEAPSAQSAAPAPAVGPVATAVPVPPAPDQPAAAAKPGGTEKPTAPEKPVATDKPPAPEKLPIVASTEPNPPNAPPANQEIAKTASATLATPLMSSNSMMAPPDPATGKPIEPPGQPASTVTASPIPGTGTSTDQRDRVGGSTKGHH